MKMRFNKEFKKAINEKYNYSNPEFEAKIKVEKPTKYYKPKLKYTMTLVLSTMIVTLFVAVIGFNWWLIYNNKRSSNIEKMIMEEYGVSIINEVSKHECKEFTILVYSIRDKNNKKDILLALENNYNDSFAEAKLFIEFNSYVQTYEVNDKTNFFKLGLSDQNGELNIKLLINNEVKLNFIHIY